MYIIAKKRTAFEQGIKDACDKIKTAEKLAIALVEKSAGAKPIGLTYIYHWETIVKFVPEFRFAPEEEPKIDKTILAPIAKEKGRWKPNLRTKAGKQFKEDFCEFAKENQVTDDFLDPFGIHMVDWGKGVSYYIRPCFDNERDRYMLICDDSIPAAFDKKKLKREQFDIDY